MIVNTTFHLEPSVEHEVLQWIGRAYAPSAVKAGAATPLILKIIGADMPAYAVQSHFPDADRANAWNHGVAASLRKIAADRWGEKTLAFVTMLEEINLNI